MKYYELNLLISPELSPEESNDLKEKISASIREEKGTLDYAGFPTKKKLNPSIKKNKEAFFITFSFHLEPDRIKTLETKLRSEKKILRFLIISKPPVEKVAVRGRVRVPSKKPQPKSKVELKDIEKKLEEILGE